MRKFIGLAVVIALLSFVGSAYGAVAVSDEYAEQERYVGEATNIKFEGQNVSSDGSQVTVLCNGHKDGVTTCVSDNTKSTNLTSVELAYGVIILADTGSLGSDNARYISIADGTPGQMVTIQLASNTLAAEGVLYITDDKTGTAIKQTGWDDIALWKTNSQVTLLYVDSTYGWVIIGQWGVTVT